MEFTGERYVPSLDGQIKYEHLHRYALCLELVSGKSVLDIASGEGYGSALLAGVAESVVGVDIIPEVVEYAAQQYNNYQNLKFLVGSCDAIPLPNYSVDIVTSFETIEHHDKHQEMMLEIKRVLKPGGVLIISSPNRLTYSDQANYSNPFHVKELYYDELLSLLNQNFKFTKMHGQRLAIGSFIFPLYQSQQNSLNAYTGNINELKQQICTLNSPIYFLAICSDEADNIPSNIGSVYIDEYDDLLKNAWDKTQTDLAISPSQLRKTQIQLEQTQAKLETTQTELEHYQDIVKGMKSSKFWILRTIWFQIKHLLRFN